MVYFFVTVVIVVNVVIAFFIDIFAAQLASTAAAKQAGAASASAMEASLNPTAAASTYFRGSVAARAPEQPLPIERDYAWFAPINEVDVSSPTAAAGSESATATPVLTPMVGPAGAGTVTSSGAMSMMSTRSTAMSSVAPAASLVEWKILNRMAARTGIRPSLRQRILMQQPQPPLQSVFQAPPATPPTLALSSPALTATPSPAAPPPASSNNHSAASAVPAGPMSTSMGAAASGSALTFESPTPEAVPAAAAPNPTAAAPAVTAAADTPLITPDLLH
jgi:hypothetical protein